MENKEIREKEKAVYNELPVLTFRWLRANHINLEPKDEELNGNFNGDYIKEGMDLVKVLDNAKDIVSQMNFKYFNEYKGTNEIELNKVINRANVINDMSSKDGDKASLSYEMKEGDNLLEVNRIYVGKGEKLTVVTLYKGEGTEASTLNLIKVEEEGELNLIKINLLGDSIRHIDQRYAEIDRKGKFNYINCDLGAMESIINYKAELIGDEAEGYLKSIYVGDGTRLIDLSHIMNHRGLKCSSDMEIRGALKDKSKKYFRGTLDFKTGSTGSEGGEVETVMLLNKDVRSFAIPLLLCTEDDVIGNHAASAGQIDEDKLFYLMSRGFSMDDAKRIIVESAFRPIIDTIPEEELREAITLRVEEMMKKV